MPRDFDVSPYYQVIKLRIAAGFDFKGLIWEDLPPVLESAIHLGSVAIRPIRRRVGSFAPDHIKYLGAGADHPLHRARHFGHADAPPVAHWNLYCRDAELGGADLHLDRPAVILIRESKTCEGVTTDSAEWPEIREAHSPNPGDEPTGQPVAEQLLRRQGAGIARPNVLDPTTNSAAQVAVGSSSASISEGSSLASPSRNMIASTGGMAASADRHARP